MIAHQHRSPSPCRLAFCLCMLTGMLLAAGGCDAMQTVLANRQSPTAEVTGVKLTGLSLQDATLDFDVKVSNPYGFDLPLVDLDYALATDGQAFLTGSSALSGVVPANGSRTIKLPATVAFKDVLTAAKGIKPGAVVPYRANMTVTSKSTALGNLSLPMSKAGELPIPAAPQVAVENVAWKSLGLQGATADIRLRVTNPNSFGLDLSRMAYRISLSGNEVANTSTTQKTAFKPGGTTVFNVPISVSPMKLGAAAIKVFRDRSASYSLAGDLTVDTPFGRIAMPYENAGTTAQSQP